MQTVTIFAPSVLSGTGTKADPKEITLFSRLDILGFLIKDNLICLKSDGTFQEKIEALDFQTQIFMDLGHIAIIRQTIPKFFLESTKTYLENKLGYPPSWGETLPEFKSRCILNKAFLKNEVATAGIILPSAVNDSESVIQYVTAYNVPTKYRALKTYYVSRLSGGGSVWPAVFRGTKTASEDGVDPVVFNTVMTTIEQAPSDSPAKQVHSLFEIYYLDRIIRAI